MKYLIVGLGNIGSDYENTRHNIGFNTLDAFAKASNVVFEPNRLADTATTKHKGRTLLLIKPTTFMNLSGKAVNYWMQAEKIPLERVLIITDDIALPFGSLRLKGKGSDGGHNGLKNIQEILGTQNYARLRFGVGSEFSKGTQVQYVLGKWDEEEAMKLPERIEKCVQIIAAFTTNPLARVMSDFNGK
ncbi:MAG: aminoacyl-tRNA hydrolase [Vicingaceae bacterium]